MPSSAEILSVKNQMEDHLTKELIPFWTERGCDKQFGGYLTDYDAVGHWKASGSKFIVTQARMLWGFSALLRRYPHHTLFQEAAEQGASFIIEHFWDRERGGWFWSTDRAGTPEDRGKVVYGQSFALYAMAEYALATGDERGKTYAEKTFDLLQKYAADTLHGGYFENLEEDWTCSPPGYPAGDRKSLDIHMHLLEAYTTLLELTGEEIHRRKLNEVIELILEHMIDREAGCGCNQFTVDFRPIPAICIRRTWNDDRGSGETLENPMDTTSYGHNLELSWLLNRAACIMGGEKERFFPLTEQILRHSLRYGLDCVYGGVYRDGPHKGEALVRDKEWWQNCESMVGFIDAFYALGDEAAWKAFRSCWSFNQKYMICHEVGEWRQLLTRSGAPLISDMGNPWKGMYHTGRAMLECIAFLDKIYVGMSKYNMQAAIS